MAILNTDGTQYAFSKIKNELNQLKSDLDSIDLDLKMDLLWTNASPTSEFQAQTISLNLSNYKIVFIVFSSYTVNINSRYSVFASYIDDGNYSASIPSSDLRRRNYTVSVNGISFSQGEAYENFGGTTYESNFFMIPTQIYGVK